MKKCGILLPIFSLPSRYGIGGFGKSAYEFIDFLKAAGQSYWQILPLSQTSFGDSPYQSPSAFAGNPYFIDPDMLAAEGYLSSADLEALTLTGENIDYGRLYTERYPMLRRAYEVFKKSPTKDFLKFKRENSFWLETYALFMAIKDDMGGREFLLWEKELLHGGRDKALEVRYAEKMGFYEFVQYEFMKQWEKLHKYANRNGIKIIGDIPIYVSLDSADVWGNPEEFLLDGDLKPSKVAGVPPDAFSAEGQLWGNPLYNYGRMREGGYKWWCQRIAHAARLYDKIRIDHFIGFSNFFAIHADAESPKQGSVIKGPGEEIFKCIKAAVPKADIIAEDLGMLREGVDELLEATGFPGMKVIQFSFEGEDNPHAPKNHKSNSIVYTGTHDNQTSKGFWQSLPAEARLRYGRLLPKGYSDPADRLIAYAMSSISDTVIIPMQDYMRKGDEARINAPSTTTKNWAWMLPQGYRRAALLKRVKSFAVKYKRANPKKCK